MSNAIQGAAIVLLGALEACPRRLVARAVKELGGDLRRGLSRRTRYAVVSHKLVAGDASMESVDHRLGEAQSFGATLISENAFLAMLGRRPADETPRDLTTRQLLEQSGLDLGIFERLRLFDAFEATDEPFAFRDLVAARQYARLAGQGVDWLALIRAAHARQGEGGIASVRLERAGDAVFIKSGEALSDLSGQMSLELPVDESDPAEECFEAAREAEEGEVWDRAAQLYRRCAEMEPKDPVVAFNLSNVLMRMGERAEARRYLNKVLRLDPRYAEAWYNLAALSREEGDFDAAKRHLRQAITADPGYPDPLYNLALLEFDAGDHERATRLWERYRELDPDSTWGQKAKYGLQLIAMMRDGDAAADEVLPKDRRQLAQ